MVMDMESVQGGENYFTYSLLYQDSLETDKNPRSEKLDSGNEAYVELEAEEECLESWIHI